MKRGWGQEYEAERVLPLKSFSILWFRGGMGEETQRDQRDAFEALDLGGLDSKLSLIPCMTLYTSKSLYGAQGS